MSLRYKIECESSSLPMRYVVKFGYWSKLVFDNVKDATRCFEAAMKSRGMIKGFDFKLTRDGEEYNASKEIAVPSNDEITISTERIGTEGEVLVNSIWKPFFCCDGVPKGDGSSCGCWRTTEVRSTMTSPWFEPDDSKWIEYVENGKTRHMCPVCQSKELKVETVVTTKVSC